MTAADRATSIRVRGAVPYDVIVGSGLLTGSDELVGLLGPAVRRVAVVHARTLRETARGLQARLGSRGLDAILAEVPDGEAAKDMSVAGEIWTQLGQAGVRRRD